MKYPPVPTDAPAEIGKKYLVPCIRYGYGSFGRGWVPILGPEHDDYEIIGIKGKHYHVDTRFLTASQLRENDWRAPTVVCKTDDHDAYKLAVKPRVCIRNAIDFPAIYQDRWPKELKEAFKDHKLKDCFVCPHKGFHLKPVEDSEGFAICPGHGLVWNLLEKRMATEEEEIQVRFRRVMDGVK